MKFATKLLHAPSKLSDPYEAMATPIYQTATFAQEHADSFGSFDYSRSGNPTRAILEEQVAALEHGTHGYAFASGMAALAALMRLLRPGDEVLADWDVYGGTSRLLASSLERANIRVHYANATDTTSFASSITSSTRLILLESPTNPLLRILDLQAIANIAKAAGCLFAVDNSTLSPYLQNPLELGADLVIHSATKYLGGHSDVTGGLILVKAEKLAKEIAFIQNSEGSALGPFDSFLILRGLKTLKLRMDAQQQNAMKIAEYLSHRYEVHYPGLTTHPGHDIQLRQARGFGSVLSFRAKTVEQAKRVTENTKLFKIAVSFGSVHSTISMPSAMSHASVPADLREARGIPAELVRLSIGAEDAEDLIEDLERSLQ
ncbi:MAG: PLP-dependent transferase [Acidobacteriaceae bacterium]|nr:PLP-dependent transferase [Acidobacteriaceae bacterium]